MTMRAIGDMSDEELTSPGRATSSRAAVEAALSAMLQAALDSFMEGVREALNAGEVPSPAMYRARWEEAVGDAFPSDAFVSEAYDIAVANAVESSVADDAYTAAQELVQYLAEAGLDEGERGEVIELAFTPVYDSSLRASGGEAFATGRAARARRALWENAGSAVPGGGQAGSRSRTSFLDALLTPAPPSTETPTAVEPPSWLPGAGERWGRRVARDARTLSTSLQGSISLQRMRSRGLKNKRWVTRHDSRVRTSHHAADGQAVPLDQPFTVGGHALMYPGDRSAPIQEWVNCRCILTGLRGKQY